MSFSSEEAKIISKEIWKRLKEKRATIIIDNLSTASYPSSGILGTIRRGEIPTLTEKANSALEEATQDLLPPYLTNDLKAKLIGKTAKRTPGGTLSSNATLLDSICLHGLYSGSNHTVADKPLNEAEGHAILRLTQWLTGKRK